jgi:hypothetical protein
VQGLGGPKQTVRPEELDLWERQCEAVLKLVLRLLESWTGVIALSSNGMLAPLVNALRVPQPELHHRVIDAIFAALHTAFPTRPNPFAASDQPQQEIAPAVARAMSLDMPPPLERHHNLLDNQTAVLLMGLVNAGLLEVLVELAKAPPAVSDSRRRGSLLLDDSSAAKSAQANRPLATKAAVLLGEIHFLSNKLLHPSQGVEL